MRRNVFIIFLMFLFVTLLGSQNPRTERELIPDFAESARLGVIPFTVEFTDLSTGDNINSWSWDFNGDGIEDSNVQNPVYTYNVIGTYSVSLTIDNGTGAVTKTKPNSFLVRETPFTEGTLGFDVQAMEAGLYSAYWAFDLDATPFFHDPNMGTWAFLQFDWNIDGHGDGTLNGNPNPPGTGPGSGVMTTISTIYENADLVEEQSAVDLFFTGFEITFFEHVNTVNPEQPWDTWGEAGDHRIYSYGIATLSYNDNVVMEFNDIVLDAVIHYPGPIGDGGSSGYSNFTGIAQIDAANSDPLWIAEFDPYDTGTVEFNCASADPVIQNVYGVYDLPILLMEPVIPEYQIGWGNLQWPLQTITLAGVATENIYGQVWIDGVTSEPGAAPGLTAEVGYGATGSDPGEDWTWFDTVFNGDVGNNDEYVGQLTANEPGNYHYTYRYRLSDQDWYYAAERGALTVNTDQEFANITFRVDMNWQELAGNFDAEIDWVDVAGNFNGWNGSGAMAAVGDGIYEYTIELEVGYYCEYKYRINGDWDLAELTGLENRSANVPASGTIMEEVYDDWVPEISWVDLISPQDMTLFQYETSENIYGQVLIEGLTILPGAAPLVEAQVGYGSGEMDTWNWQPAEYLQDSGNNDEYTGIISADEAGDYEFGYRFRFADGSWFYGLTVGQLTVLPVENPELIPDFTESARLGVVPFTVVFTDLSTGANINSWSWDFDGDDIEDSNEQNPQYTYNIAGTYSVSLTIDNGTGAVTKTKPNSFLVRDTPFTEGTLGFDVQGMEAGLYSAYWAFDLDATPFFHDPNMGTWAFLQFDWNIDGHGDGSMYGNPNPPGTGPGSGVMTTISTIYENADLVEEQSAVDLFFTGFEITFFEHVNTVNPEQPWDTMGEAGDHRLYSYGIASLSYNDDVVMEFTDIVLDAVIHYPGPIGDGGVTGYSIFTGIAQIDAANSDPLWIAEFDPYGTGTVEFNCDSADPVIQNVYGVYDLPILLMEPVIPEYQIGWGNLQWPLQTITLTGVATENIYGQVWIDGVTSEPGAASGLIAETGYGPVDSVPGEDWTWFAAVFNGDAGNNDEYVGQFTVNEPGSYHYTYRYRLIGQDWYYAAERGLLTVTAIQEFADVTFHVDMSWQELAGNFDSLADWVDVAGSFNDWNGSGAMTAIGDGIYEYTIELEIGYSFQYKYRINGDWDLAELPGLENREGNVQAGGTLLEDVYNDWVPAVAWYDLVSPLELTLNQYEQSENIYGQIYIEGLTNMPGAAPQVEAQVGYGLGDMATWNWQQAAYFQDAGNNDEFAGTIFPEETGDFNFGYRFRFNQGIWQYGATTGLVTVLPAVIPELIINEINFNCHYTIGAEADFEFIEIYNPGEDDVDLSNVSVSGSVSYAFDPGTTIAADGYLVIAADPVYLYEVYDLENVVGPFTGSLPNDQGIVILQLSNRRLLLDQVNYDGNWYYMSEHGYSSLELRNPDMDNSVEEAWCASIGSSYDDSLQHYGGTPGMINLHYYTIYDIQSTTDNQSEKENEMVQCSGIITAKFFGDNVQRYVIQVTEFLLEMYDYSGVFVYANGMEDFEQGDIITVTGLVTEDGAGYSDTVIDPWDFVLESSGNMLPEPVYIDLIAADEMTEDWEGVLITTSGNCTLGNDNGGMWSLSDGLWTGYVAGSSDQHYSAPAGAIIEGNDYTVRGIITGFEIWMRSEADYNEGLITQPGILSGMVTDSETGEGILDAVITAESPETREVFTTTTGYDGDYEMSLPVGEYNVSCSAEGYEYPDLVTVDIAENVTVIVDFTLSEINLPPVLNLPDIFSFNEDEILAIDMNDYASDPESDNLMTGVSGNEMINVTVSGMELTFSAPVNWNGIELVTIWVSDAARRTVVSEEIDIQVLAVNDPPWIDLPEEITIDLALEILPFEFDVSPYCNDVDEDILTLSFVNSGDVTVSVDGMILYIEPVEMITTTAQITVTVTDPQAANATDVMNINILAAPATIIHGTVQDDVTLELLAGVAITFTEIPAARLSREEMADRTEYYATTGINGYYEVELAPGAYTLLAELDNYENYMQSPVTVDEGENLEVSFLMTYSPSGYPTVGLYNFGCLYGDGLVDFELAGISNLDSGCSSDEVGYGDFTEMTAEVSAGQLLEATAASGYSGNRLKIWADFNNDFQFDEDTELIAGLFNLWYAGTQNQVPVTIPESVTAGSYRMRARTVWNEDVFTATSVEDYGEIEDYTLVVTASQEPVTLTKELTAGWNWISLNLECDDGTVSGILSSIGENGAYIKNQSTFATYYSGVGWIGTMTAFELTSLYKLQMDNAADWVITGFPADPLDYVNNLTAGWNWISYLPQESLDINQALATLASAADYIKNVASFSTYYPGVGWFGTLSVMNPLEGYMIDMNSPADLIYPSGLARNSKVEIFPDTARRRWLVNPADYEFNGSIVASVLDMEPGDELAVFTGDECRGVSQLLDTRKLFGQYTFALMAFTNETAGEDITFRFYDQSADAEYELKGNIHFLPDAVIGDFSQPLLLTLPALYGGENLNSVTALGRCIPNPFNPSGVIWYDLETGINVKIEVYNIRGQKITTLVDQWQGRGKHNIEWRGIDDAGNDVASGIYLIQMKTASYQAMKRIILLK